MLGAATGSHLFGRKGGYLLHLKTIAPENESAPRKRWGYLLSDNFFQIHDMISGI